MTGTELATRPVGALALEPGQGDWTERQRAALDQLGLHEAPAGDLAVFLHQSQRTGLDPFTRQIYMIGRWDSEQGRKKWTIQTAIDGFRVVAERHGQYGGQGDIEWCGEDGQWRDVWVSNTPPVAARATVIRRDWPTPIRATAHFREYAVYVKSGGLNRMWREKGALMIAKCAEALALRKAFPQDLSGLYTAEEMDREPIQAPSERADRPTASPPQPAEQQPEQPSVDWNAEITKCAGDYDKLRALWTRASQEAPDDSDVLVRIMEAGTAAKAARDAGEEPIDAEVVEELSASDTTTPAAPAGAAPEPLQKKVIGYLDRLGVQPADRADILSRIIGRFLSKSTDLSTDEGALAADKLHVVLAASAPRDALAELLAMLEPRVTQPQLTAIAAALAAHNVKDRADRLAVVGFLIGDRIASTAQLTRSEASHVIDTIARHTEEGRMADTIAAARAAVKEAR